MKPSEIFWTITGIIGLFLVKGLLYYFVISIELVILIEFVLFIGTLLLDREPSNETQKSDWFFILLSVPMTVLFIITLVVFFTSKTVYKIVVKFNNWIDAKFQ